MNKQNNEKTTLPAVVQSALTAQKINLDEVNLILPTETYGQVLGEFDKLTIEIVRVDPDPAQGEVYEVAKGKLSLCKRPLEKMAIALGVVWDSKTTGIVESTRRKSRAKATGAIKRDNIPWLPCTEEKTVDLDAIEEEQRIKQEKYAAKGKLVGWDGNRPIHEPWSKHGGEAAKKVHIDLEVREAVCGYWKFKDERANTGAKERVIRFLLALKNTYTAEELSKPIAFPCISTDAKKLLADPETRQKALDKITDHATAIYGGRTETPQIEQQPEYEVSENGEENEVLAQEQKEEEKDKLPWGDQSEETEEEKKTHEIIEDLQIRRKKYDEQLSDKAKAEIDEVLAREKPDMKTISALVDKFNTWEGLLKEKEASHAKR